MRVEIRSVRKSAHTLLAVIVTASVLLPCHASAAPIALAPYRLNDLRAEFNRASDRVRIVALLSPTCGGDQPPMPAFWMHQLYADTGADQRFCLNPTVLLGKVADLLR
jgi:hypothetical protein